MRQSLAIENPFNKVRGFFRLVNKTDIIRLAAPKGGKTQAPIELVIY